MNARSPFGGAQPEVIQFEALLRAALSTKRGPRTSRRTEDAEITAESRSNEPPACV
jgi:hypothetical protein